MWEQEGTRKGIQQSGRQITRLELGRVNVRKFTHLWQNPYVYVLLV